MATGAILQRSIHEALADRPDRLVLDLRALDFMDSSGIATICRLEGDARQRGIAVRVVRGRPHVQRVLEMTGLTDLLTFIDAPED